MGGEETGGKKKKQCNGPCLGCKKLFQKNKPGKVKTVGGRKKQEKRSKQKHGEGVLVPGQVGQKL